MMEKYGVDMSNLPPTDDQYRELSRLRKEAGYDVSPYGDPRNREEAEEQITKLAGEIGERKERI
jgi:hypothetical protein